ncbi:MAG: nitroreductase family protein [Dehalococcoidia bacterium]|jgi:nitroreductase/NAD-dependent dihydropyrimidine dehydrogenase PreA subunit
MIPTVIVKADLCSKCAMCVQECPGKFYIQASKDSFPEARDLEFCNSCGHCVAICPKDAIVHSGFPQGYIQPVNQKNLPSQEAALELLRTRRSTRVFQDKPVEKQQIERIIDAARFAPTAHNTQTTEYIVVQDKKILDEMKRITANLIAGSIAKARNPLMKPMVSIILGKHSGAFFRSIPQLKRLIAAVKSGTDRILRNAPVLIIFHADERSSMADINAQLAIQNAALMAYSLGLGSFYTGYILAACQRDKSIRRLINLPQNHKVYGGLAIGYPKFEFKKWIERKTPEVSWL